MAEEVPASYLRRMTIHADGSVERRTIAEINGDFPRINDALAGKPHQFIYGLRFNEPSTLGRKLWKANADTGEMKHFDFGADSYVGEPVFVPRPGGTAEDDGWLVATVYDEKAHRSSLVVVPADDAGFERGPVARIHLPVHLPVQFHSAFAPEVQ